MRIPEEAQRLFDTIVENAESLIPALDDLAARGVIGEKVRHDVLSGVTRYLPDTLGSYLALPPAYLKLHKGNNGNPTSMLIEQLGMIDRHLETCLKEAFGAHADALSVQGKFLDEKTGRNALH